VALLSNSSGLYREEVKESISQIDLPVFKLDAGDEDTFTQINRPTRDVAFSRIVQSLQAVKGIYIQTVLMAGTPSNVREHTLAAYFRTIARIKPRGVQLYSLDRPVANRYIKRVPPAQLEEIAVRGRKETGIDFTSFYL
jgi:wyosine [tRNA(Phe)-imidazoG37] synthetase (radical SAM superfamily)